MIGVDAWAGAGLGAGTACRSTQIGKTSRLFGRGGKGGGGLFNRNVLRIGWGWKGTAQSGQDTFRIGIGHQKWHVEIWEVGPAIRKSLRRPR